MPSGVGVIRNELGSVRLAPSDEVVFKITGREHFVEGGSQSEPFVGHPVGALQCTVQVQDECFLARMHRVDPAGRVHQ